MNAARRKVNRLRRLCAIVRGLSRQLELGGFVRRLGRQHELGSFVRRLGRQLDFESVGRSINELSLKLDLKRRDGKSECMVDICLDGTVCFRGLCDR